MKLGTIVRVSRREVLLLAADFPPHTAADIAVQQGIPLHEARRLLRGWF